MKPALFPLLPFVADETPWSWVARMAAFHARSSIGTFLRDLNLDPHLMASGDRDEIGLLCQIAGQDPHPVLGNTLTRMKGGVHALDREMLRTILCPPAETRFCPACLAQDDAAAVAAKQDPAIHRRERLIWRFRPVRTCPHHGLNLECRTRPDGGDAKGVFGESVPETGDVLRSIAHQGGRCFMSGLQAYVVGRILGDITHDWLDTVPLEQVVRLTELLGAVLSHGPDTFLEDLSDTELDAAAATGWDHVSDGAQGIISALQILNAERDVGAARKNFAFRDRCGNLIDEVESYPTTSPIRKMFERHLVHSASS